MPRKAIEHGEAPYGKILAAGKRLKDRIIPPRKGSSEGAGEPMTTIGLWNKCGLIGTNRYGKICMKIYCQCLLDSNLSFLLY